MPVNMPVFVIVALVSPPATIAMLFYFTADQEWQRDNTQQTNDVFHYPINPESARPPMGCFTPVNGQNGGWSGGVRE